MPARLNLLGQRFVRLLVLADAGNNRHGKSLWHCRCDCGKDVIVCANQLASGGTRSCGCIRTKFTADQKRQKIRETSLAFYYRHHARLREKRFQKSHLSREEFDKCARRMTVEQRDGLARDYAEGMSSKKVARKYGFSQTSALRLLKKKGMTRDPIAARREYELDDSAFERITPESAYWVGFLMADGCVSRRPTSWFTGLRLQCRDTQHVKLFRGYLKATHPISISSPRTASYKGSMIRPTSQVFFGISSTRIAEALIAFGVTPRKTFTARVHDSLAMNRDFWRGAVDGDGWVSLKPNKRINHLALWPTIGLACASKLLIDQFRIFCISVCPTIRANVIKNNAVWRLCVGGINAIDLIRCMYTDHTISLSRKQSTADAIIETAKEHPSWLKQKGSPPRRPP